MALGSASWHRGDRGEHRPPLQGRAATPAPVAQNRAYLSRGEFESVWDTALAFDDE